MRKHCRTRAPRDVLATIVLFACMGCHTPQDADSINNPFTVSGVRVEPDSLNAYLAAHRGFTSRGGEMRCAYRPLGQERNRVFVWAICSELLAIDGHLVDGSGMSLPAAFEIEVQSGNPRIVGVEVPEDGNRYAPSIRRIFPASTWRAIFSHGSRHEPAAGLYVQLRAEAAARFRLPPAAASEPRRQDRGKPITVRREAPHSGPTLDSAARRVVEFLRGKASFDQIELSDTVTLYVTPEGGGGHVTFARKALRNPAAWGVKSGANVFSFVPPAGMTRLTTKVGRHFDCYEQLLAPKLPRLAHLPHVGTRLQPENTRSCLQTWNVTFVFDSSVRPRVVAAIYDQWEW